MSSQPIPTPSDGEHNASHGNLHRLPNELILMIAEYLPGCEILVLGASARRFFWLVRSSGFLSRLSPSPTIAHHRFMNLRRRDRLCVAEKAGLLKDPVCSACCNTHKADHFSTEQRAVAPEARKCIAIAGSIRLCAHKKINHLDLQELCAELPVRSICAHKSHDRSNLHMFEIGFTSNMVFSWTHLRIEVLHSTVDVSTALFEALDTLPKPHEPICPHLRFSDLRAHVMKYAERYKITRSSLDTYRFNCSSPSCSTGCFFQYGSNLKILPGPDTDFIKLCSFRILGREPYSPLWLSQLSEAQHLVAQYSATSSREG